MKRFAMKLGVVSTLLFLAGSPASATVLSMTLTDVTGGGSTSCDNGIGLCAAGWGGAINGNVLTFSGAVGGWTSTLTAAASNSPGALLAGATLDLTQLVLTNNTNASRDFEIRVTGWGYTTPPGDPLSFFGSASTSSSGVIGLIESESYFDPSNTGALLNMISCSFVPSTNNSCAEPTIYVNNGGGAYSLTQILRIRVGALQDVNLTANSIVKAPEPGSLLLLGLGLLGFAAVRRRRTGA